MSQPQLAPHPAQQQANLRSVINAEAGAWQACVEWPLNVAVASSSWLSEMFILVRGLLRVSFVTVAEPCSLHHLARTRPKLGAKLVSEKSWLHKLLTDVLTRLPTYHSGRIERIEKWLPTRWRTEGAPLQ